MKQALKPIRWTLVNGGILVLAWMATVNGTEWAGNLVKFILWVSALMYLLLTITIDRIMDDTLAEKAKRSVPKWMDNGFDGVLCLLLAYHGWFLYATLSLFQWMLYEFILRKSDEYREAQPA